MKPSFETELLFDPVSLLSPYEPPSPVSAGQSLTGHFLFETSCCQVYCTQCGAENLYYIRLSEQQELIQIQPEVFHLLNEERLQSIRWRNEQRRHLDLRSLEDACACADSGADPQSRMDCKERLWEVLEFLKQASPVQYRRFLLHQIYGYSCREIAQLDGCHPSAVSQSVNQVRKKLQDFQKK